MGGDDRLVEAEDLIAQLITAKPVVVLANVGPDDAAKGNAYTERLEAHLAFQAAKFGLSGSRRCVVVSAPLEAVVAQLDDEEFRREYLESYGLQDSDRALDRVLEQSRELLRLLSFLTVGEIEAKAWF